MALRRWSVVLPGIDKEILLNAVTKLYQITNMPKFRSFQYRLLFHVIITNVQLQIYGIKENNKCTFCAKLPETTDHLFLLCDKVDALWQEICNFYDIAKEELTLQKVMLNLAEPNPRKIQNFIVLCAKIFIYNTRCAQETLSFERFRIWFESLQVIEKNIEIKNDKLFTHELRWNNVKRY